jgi:hypothetical protein
MDIHRKFSRAIVAFGKKWDAYKLSSCLRMYASLFFPLPPGKYDRGRVDATSCHNTPYGMADQFQALLA